MSVRRQGYYEYQNRKGSQRGVQDRVLTTKIKDVFYENRRIYGARKIQEKLREDGWWISRKRIRRLMDRAGLTPVSWRRRVQTTVSAPPGLSISQPAQAGFQRRAAESDMGIRFHLRVHRRRLVVFVYLH